MRTVAVVVVLPAAWVMVAHAALAQPSGEAEAQAFALFKEAVTALEKQDYASACPRFEAAMKLYSSPSTQFNLARCLEHDGKVASAWAAYQRVLVLNHATTDASRRAALDQRAGAAAAALEPSLPRVRIVAPSPPPGLRVVEGTQELPSASFGIALPTDPGPHELVASAPGYEDLHVTVTAERGKQTDVPIVLKPVAIAPIVQTPIVQTPPQPVTTTEPIKPPTLPVTRLPPPPERARAPAWAWATGGLGLVALGVGAGLGAAALGKQSALESACGSQFPHCPNDAQAMTKVGGLEDARNVDRGAFIGLAAVGVAGIVTGVVGLTAARKAKEDRAPRAGLVVSPFGSPGGGGLMARGGF